MEVASNPIAQIPTRAVTEASIDVNRWRLFLSQVIADPVIHAKWLNTLSLMEHVGCRKIVKALNTYTLDQHLLRHIAEEARHAHFFKRLSLRVMPSLCEQYQPNQLLCGDAAQRYMQGLDHDVTDWVAQHAAAASPELSYVCVTLLVEERAMEIYPVYEDVLKQAKLSLSLRGIISEEEKHMDEMHDAFSRMGFDWTLHRKALTAIEEQHLSLLLNELELELARVRVQR